MEDPSRRRGTTRVEKTKTVAVGDGGTTIEVRASERGRCMATVHGRDKKLGERESTDTDGARDADGETRDE